MSSPAGATPNPVVGRLAQVGSVRASAVRWAPGESAQEAGLMDLERLPAREERVGP